MNPEFRKRILLPSLIPIGAFVFIGALVFGFSRVLLIVTKEGSVVIGTLMAGCILFAAGALSKGGRLKDSQRLALVVFGVLVVGGGVAAGASLHTREVEGHIEVAETLVAQNTAFDNRQFRLPADTPVGIRLVNQDAGLQHNVSIYDSPARGRAIHIGAIFPGVATRVEELEDGLPTGVYFFQCDVHANIPAMTGNIIVGNAPPPPQPSPTGTTTGPAPAPTSPAPSPTTPPTGAPAPVALIAKNLAFDKTSLTFAANQLIMMDFDNQDPGQLHNFSLYRDSAFTQNLFRGEFTTGPARRRYEFTAPGAGTYFFQCDAHPQPSMRGTVTVR